MLYTQNMVFLSGVQGRLPKGSYALALEGEEPDGAAASCDPEPEAPIRPEPKEDGGLGFRGLRGLGFRGLGV